MEPRHCLGYRVIRGSVPAGEPTRYCTDRLVYAGARKGTRAAWRSWIRSGRHSRCPTRWRSPTGSPRSATSIRTSTRWRSSCSGPGSGRWRAGSRRSPRRGDFVEYEILDQSIIVLRDRRPGGARLPERLPAPRRPGRRGPRDAEERVHLPLPRLVLRPGRQEHLRLEGKDLRRAQPAAGGHRPHAGAVRGVGRVRLDQPRRRRTAVAGVHRAVRHHHRRLEGGVDAHRVVVRVPSPGELEAGRRGVHGAVPRDRDPPRAGHSRAVPAPRPGRVRPAGVRRRGAPLPPRDERRHGRDGPRQRRARRRGPAGHRAARRPDPGHADLAPHAQRRGRSLAPSPGF